MVSANGMYSWEELSQLGWYLNCTVAVMSRSKLLLHIVKMIPSTPPENPPEEEV